MKENRLKADDDHIAEQKAKRDGYRFSRYEPGRCLKCSRPRVGLRKNGKRICEKCYWDQDLNVVDFDAAQLD